MKSVRQLSKFSFSMITCHGHFIHLYSQYITYLRYQSNHHGCFLSSWTPLNTKIGRSVLALTPQLTSTLPDLVISPFFFRATLLTPIFLLFSYPRALLQTQETCTGKPGSRPAPLKSESIGGVK